MPQPIERILSFVQATCAAQIEPDHPLTPTTPLFSSRLIDSMGLIEFFAFVEREFGVSWDATVEELAALDTAANVAQAIERLQAAGPRRACGGATS